MKRITRITELQRGPISENGFTFPWVPHFATGEFELRKYVHMCVSYLFRKEFLTPPSKRVAPRSRRPSCEIGPLLGSTFVCSVHRFFSFEESVTWESEK